MLQIKIGNDNLGLRTSLTTVTYRNKSDIQKATITYEKVGGIETQATGNTQNNEIKTGFTTNISFYGAEAKYLSDVLISHASSRANWVKLEAYEDCCGINGEWLLLFNGIIRYNNIDWSSIDGSISDCYECHVDVTVETDDSVSNRYKCLSNKLIKDPCKDIDGNKIPCPNSFTGSKHFQDYDHPFVPYCKCPDAGIEVILPGIYLLLESFVPIILLINLIVSIVNGFIELFGGDGIDGMDGFADLGWTADYLNEIRNLMIPCLKSHIAPYVRDYITNVCEQCNMRFESSILNDSNSPYYNLVYYSPTGDDGDFEIDDNRKDFWAKSAPTFNGVRFLNDMATVFNSRWWVANDTVHFENYDISPSLFYDFTDPNKRHRLIDVNFKWSKTTLPAAASFDYFEDGIDEVANSNTREYREVVDYHYDLNGTFHTAAHLIGMKEYRFNYGSFRAWHDGLPRCYIETLAYRIYVDIVTAGAIDQIFNEADDGYMFMTGQKVTIPKLLILRDDNNRLIMRKDHPTKAGEYFYNYPMYISDGRPDIGVDKVNQPVEDNIYKFFTKNHPLREDVGTLYGIEFTIKYAYDCGILRDFITRLTTVGFDISVLIPYCGDSRLGRVDKVEVTQNFITLTGLF